MRTSRLLLTLTAAAISGLASAKGGRKEEFSLVQLSPLSRSDVTRACYDAYTAPIAGCGGGGKGGGEGGGGGGGDGGGGGGGSGSSSASCSDACVSSLGESEAAIWSACSDAFVGVDDLLRRIIDGASLVGIVCPDYDLFSESTLVADDLTFAATTLVLPDKTYSAIPSPLVTVDPDAAIAVDTRPAPSPIAAVTTKTSALDLDTAPSPTVPPRRASAGGDGASPSGTVLPSSSSQRNSVCVLFGVTALMAAMWSFF